MFFNSQYLIYMVPAFILMALTSWYVKSAYRRWLKVPARSRMTGYQAAQRLITSAGLYGIQIDGIRGNLTDNYDPRSKTLHLSQGVAEGASVASLAVAAHELGHAMQDEEGYFPLRFRSALVPMVNIGSNLGWILIMIGLFLSYAGMTFGVDIAWLGLLSAEGRSLPSQPSPWSSTPRNALANCWPIPASFKALTSRAALTVCSMQPHSPMSPGL
jgi:Zn-dependent membrane protease YugP